MTDTEQRSAATKFYNDWRGIGNEKSDCHRFWIDFFTNVLGIEDVLKKIEFEKSVVVNGQTKYIDKHRQGFRQKDAAVRRFYAHTI